jgi:hypothetical protein
MERYVCRTAHLAAGPKGGRQVTTTDRPASTPGEFALCLTHDVDRPYKTYQWVYEAFRERAPAKLQGLVSGDNPYWQFEEIMHLEDSFGVRSAFYFLQEPPLTAYDPPAWLQPGNWVEHLGRYDVTAPAVREAVERLHDGGWEVGLHASRLAARDPARLAAEKRRLESVLGDRVTGCRHHHLELAADTWDHHRRVGLEYDASLGSAALAGFQHGSRPYRPVGDFLVFPLSAMEVALPDPAGRGREARDAVDRLLRRAAREGAVMTVLWHPRYFAESEFPGYRDLYRYLLRRARELGAWVGPPRDLLGHPEGPSTG